MFLLGISPLDRYPLELNMSFKVVLVFFLCFWGPRSLSRIRISFSLFGISSEHPCFTSLPKPMPPPFSFQHIANLTSSKVSYHSRFFPLNPSLSFCFVTWFPMQRSLSSFPPGWKGLSPRRFSPRLGIQIRTFHPPPIPEAPNFIDLCRGASLPPADNLICLAALPPSPKLRGFRMVIFFFLNRRGLPPLPFWYPSLSAFFKTLPSRSPAEPLPRVFPPYGGFQRVREAPCENHVIPPCWAFCFSCSSLFFKRHSFLGWSLPFEPKD